MIARLIRQGRGLRISPKDLTFDVNKFFLLYGFALVLRARHRLVGVTGE